MAVIRGSKGGSGGGDKGGNRGTEIASVAYMKILLALTEGEAAGDFTGKDIYLDGTPLLDDAGNENFPGVTWEWRSGTVDQDYIAGFPAVENEISVGTELKYGTPWVKSINNTQLSAVRLRLKFPNGIYKLRDSGGKNGYRIAFAIDISTDGGSYVEYGTDEADGIANAGYERSYRIDLPAATSGWQIRVRRLTENTTDGRHADISRIESMTDIVDAKLRYPHTSLLFVQFDAKLFDGKTPNVTVKMKGIIVRVPANYDPVSRTYSGIWDGTFKWAWTNNPAWIFYDLVLNKRYGLGKRITADLVDKWTLYQIAQYCDAPVSDGAGGKEARYLCDLYISQRTDAWTVLMDLANIFRGMISWSNNLLSVDADMPRELDPDFVFNKSNIVGAFNFSSTSEKTNYSSAIVTYSNPANSYQDDQASAWVPEVSNRFGFNTIELSRIGCTRESEAQRHGLYAIETNRDDNGVEFKTGLEGRIPRIGKVIGINNAPLAGRDNGGRVVAVSGTTVTLDRITAAKTGDTLIVNLPTGKSEGRKVKNVSGRAVTVETAYSITPNAESAWVLDQPDLAIQLFRVKRLMVNSDNTVTINGLPYNPNKFPRVDDGAVIEDRPVSVVPPRGQGMPENITVSSVYRVEQGIGITTMIVTWDTVKNAVAYEAQWRQNNGDWINVPRTGNTRFEIDGIYAGRYVVRVRAINAQDIASVWSTSAETELTGKTGAPLPPLALTTTSLLHGVQLNWAFPEGSGDTQKTELQYSPNPNGNGAMALSDVAYPGKTYQQLGLQIAAMFWYRARIVDRIGNESPWTAWVQGMASDDIGEYYDKLTDAIKDTDAWQETQKDITENHQQMVAETEKIREELESEVESINQQVDKTVSDLSESVSQQIAEGDRVLQAQLDTASESIEQAQKDITAVESAGQKALQSAENQLKQSIAQANTGWQKAVKQETEDRIENINSAAQKAADQLLNEKKDRVAAIEGLQQVIQDGDDSLARQIAEISAGSGQQFDSFNIFYFDKSAQGWTEDDAGKVAIPVTAEGWLRPSGSTATCISPDGQAVPATAYRTAMMRIKRVGNPAWKGQFFWVGQDESGWGAQRTMAVREPEFDAEGVSVVTLADIPWNRSAPVRRYKIALAVKQDEKNYFLVQWFSVGRPAPGASTAALRDEALARTTADEAEATKRSTLAARICGSSDSNSLADLRSGLIFDEKTARISGDKAEATKREALQTQFNENRASVAEELGTLSTAQGAQAKKISGLETSLDKKADAQAFQTLRTTVNQHDKTLASQSETLTSLSNRVGKTEGTTAANSQALSGLESKVTQQGRDISAHSGTLTTLGDSLAILDSTVAKKADAQALQTLQNSVTQQGKTLASQSGAITSLENTLNALDVGGTNQIPDSGGLSSYGNVSTEKYHGNGVMAFTLKAGAAYRDLISINLSAPVDGMEYVLSFYAKAAVNGQKVRSHFYSPNSTKKSVSSQGNIFTNAGGLCDFVLTTQWQRYWVKWTQSAGSGSKKLIVARINAGTTDQTVYLSSPKFERGNVPTAWSAAPEDNASAKAVTALTSRVDSTEGALTSQGQAITTLNNTLNTTRANVNKKADAAALQTLQNTVKQQGTTLGSHTESLTSLKNSLDSTVADMDASGKIPGNLIANPSFERGLTGYSGGASFIKVINASAPHTGGKILSCETGTAAVAQTIAVVKGRTYRLGVWVRCESGTVVDNTGNNKIRIGSNTLLKDFLISPADLPTGSTWKEIAFEWKSTLTGNVDVSINSSLKAGKQYFDDFYFIDVTDRVNITANSSALTNLTSQVSTAEDKIESQSKQITTLKNSLATTNQNVSKKADAQALQTLQNTVTQQGKTLSTNSSAITQMQNAITGINANEALSVSMPGNMISNASFENGLTGYTGTNNYSVVEKLQVPHSGTVALKIIGMATPGQYVNFVKGHSYVIGVWAKQLGGTTDNGDGDNKIRVGGASGQPVFTKPFSNPILDTNWKLVSDTWKATESGRLYVSLHNRVTAGARYFDSFHVIDVTDRVNLEATSSALQTVQSTVKQQGDTLSSHGSSIINLNNSLKTTSDNVTKKADASAVQTLQNTVNKQGETLSAHTGLINNLTSSLNTTNQKVDKKAEQTALNSLSGKVDTNTKGISAANASVTTLTAAVRAGNASSGDFISNPTFDPSFSQMGLQVVSRGCNGVPAGCPFANVAKLTGRDHHPNFAAIAATTGDVYEMSALVACGAGKADFNFYLATATSSNGTVASPLFTGGNTKATAQWKRVTWRFTVSQTMVDRGYIRPFLQINQSSPFGTIWYVTDWHMRNITAAAKAQSTADATAKAVETLSNTVKQQGSDISSVGTRTTKLENGLKTTNDNVSKKADAQALQTLQNTVSQQGKTLSSQSATLTELKNDLSSTNANVDGLRGMGGNIVENGDFSQGVACWGVQQNAQNPVTFGNYGDGAKGVKMVKTNATSPGLFVNNKRPVPVDGQRRYRYIVRAKGVSGAKNMILRRWNYAAGKEGAYADKSFTLDSAWKTYTWETALSSTGVDAHAFGLYCHSSAAEIWIDSFYVFDITDEVDIAANSTAISSLNSRVTKTEDGIKTQSESITKLTNSLNTTNQNVAKKADSAALKTLQSTVTEQGKTLNTQSGTLTSLSNAINTANRKGSNPWIDSTFETYADGQKLSGSSQVIVGTSFTGTRSLRVTRNANTNGNADQLIGSRLAIRDDAVYRVEFWAMMAASEKPATGWNCAVGFNAQDKSGTNSWVNAVSVTEAGLGGRGKWVKFTGLAKNTKSGRTNAVIWISPRGANGANTPGYNLFIDGFVMTEVTDASAALDGVTATNTAMKSLTSRVEKTESTITAQGRAITSLKSDVDNKASASAVKELSTRVSKTEKTLDTHTSQITGLSTTIKDKADASAVNKLTTRVTDNEGKIKSAAESVKTISSDVGDLKATVKTQGETTASNDKQLKAMYSLKVETNNGKKVSAGIALGSDGTTSDMVFYANRFSLFNQNSRQAVPVMIAEGNELYIDSARIKDASIGMGKISHYLQSDNWVQGKQGWAINRGGGSEFNNVIVRGEIHAHTGSFSGTVNATNGHFNNVTLEENCVVKGTVYAGKIEGDVVRTFNLPVRGSVYIPPQPFNRVISIPTIMACASLQNENGNQVVYIKRDGGLVAQTSATKLNPVGLNSWLGYLGANQGTTISYELGSNYGTVMPNILVLVSKDG